MKHYLFALFWLLPAVHCLGQDNATYKFYITAFYKNCLDGNHKHLEKLPRNDNSYFNLVDEGGKFNRIVLHYRNTDDAIDEIYTIASYRIDKDTEYAITLKGVCYKKNGIRLLFQLIKNKQEDYVGFIEDSDMGALCNHVFTGNPF